MRPPPRSSPVERRSRSSSIPPTSHRSTTSVSPALSRPRAGTSSSSPRSTSSRTSRAPPRCRVRLVSRMQVGRLTRRRPLRQMLKALLYLVAMIRFDRRLTHLAPSIVHVQWALLPWLDRAFWSRWQRSGWKLVYTAHDAPPLAGTTPRLLARSYPRLIRSADAVVVHSEYARGAILETGAAAEHVHVIPAASPVSPSAFGSSRSGARQELGLPLDDPVVLFFGFIKPYKGLAVLLESLPLLRREVPAARLLVVGEVMEPRPGYEQPDDRARHLTRQSTGGRASSPASRSVRTSPPPTSSRCRISRPRRAACS